MVVNYSSVQDARAHTRFPNRIPVDDIFEGIGRVYESTVVINVKSIGICECPTGG